MKITETASPLCLLLAPPAVSYIALHLQSVRDCYLPIPHSVSTESCCGVLLGRSVWVRSQAERLGCSCFFSFRLLHLQVSLVARLWQERTAQGEFPDGGGGLSQDVGVVN